MGAATTYRGEHLDAVIQEINKRYGLDVIELTPLGGELDANFMASTASSGPRFVRLTSGSFGNEAIQWQNRVLQQLAKQPLSVQVPHLIAQQDGTIMSRFITDEAETYLRMTTWLPGVTVADIGETNLEFRHQLGVLAAEVIDSLSPLNDQADDHSHHWMVVKSGDSLRATLHEVEDPDRRALISEALDRFDAVSHDIPSLPRTVVHQDLHDFNLLAERSADGAASISGVVDFNDAVYTARVAEICVAAVYATLRQPDAFEAFLQVIEGFVTRQELNEVEIRSLFPLAVARLAVNASTWTARAKVGNAEYAEARMEATWPALKQLMQVTPAEAETRIAQLHAQRSAAQPALRAEKGRRA